MFFDSQCILTTDLAQELRSGRLSTMMLAVCTWNVGLTCDDRRVVKTVVYELNEHAVRDRLLAYVIRRD